MSRLYGHTPFQNVSHLTATSSLPRNIICIFNIDFIKILPLRFKCLRSLWSFLERNYWVTIGTLVCFIVHTPPRVTYVLFPYRSNVTQYDLVLLEALMYQSYHGLIHHVGSPPVIGVLSLECFWTAVVASGTPTTPAFIPEIMLSYGNHMTFYERLQNTLFWLWMRCVNLSDIASPCCPIILISITNPCSRYKVKIRPNTTKFHLLYKNHMLRPI